MRVILTMNNYFVNNEHFLQQHGTAVVTRMAPAYANLFLGEFETNAGNGYAEKPFLGFWTFIYDLDTWGRKTQRICQLPKQHAPYYKVYQRTLNYFSFLPRCQFTTGK